MENFSTVMIVVALALVSPDGKVLMQQRPLNKAHGGLWEFPGGKLEPGETPEQAIVREIDEELGVSIESANLLPLSFASERPGAGKRPVLLLLYIASNWQGAPTALEAGTQVKWASVDELLALPMPPLDVPLAQALIPLLEGVAKAKRPA